jgi:hypothetical protein
MPQPLSEYMRLSNATMTSIDAMTGESSIGLPQINIRPAITQRRLGVRA